MMIEAPGKTGVLWYTGIGNIRVPKDHKHYKLIMDYHEDSKGPFKHMVIEEFDDYFGWRVCAEPLFDESRLYRIKPRTYKIHKLVANVSFYDDDNEIEYDEITLYSNILMSEKEMLVLLEYEMSYLVKGRVICDVEDLECEDIETWDEDKYKVAVVKDEVFIGDRSMQIEFKLHETSINTYRAFVCPDLFEELGQDEKDNAAMFWYHNDSRFVGVSDNLDNSGAPFDTKEVGDFDHE